MKAISKQLTVMVAVCIAIGSLTGCAASSYTDEEETPPAPSVEHYFDDNLYEVQKTLEDGRTITCILYDAGYKRGAGLSCDWNPPAQ